MPTIRQTGGMSGFTNRSESEYDPFGAGHSSTSISAALGMAVARDFKVTFAGPSICVMRKPCACFECTICAYRAVCLSLSANSCMLSEVTVHMVAHVCIRGVERQDPPQRACLIASLIACLLARLLAGWLAGFMACWLRHVSEWQAGLCLCFQVLVSQDVSRACIEPQCNALH